MWVLYAYNGRTRVAALETYRATKEASAPILYAAHPRRRYRSLQPTHETLSDKGGRSLAKGPRPPFTSSYGSANSEPSYTLYLYIGVTVWITYRMLWISKPPRKALNAWCEF